MQLSKCLRELATKVVRNVSKKSSELCEKCWELSKSDEKWWQLSKSDEKCWQLSKSDEKWWQLSKSDEKCWQLSKSDEKCWQLSKSDEKCWQLSKSDEKCWQLSKKSWEQFKKWWERWHITAIVISQEKMFSRWIKPFSISFAFSWILLALHTFCCIVNFCLCPQLARLCLQLAASLNISIDEDKEDNLFKIQFWNLF